MQHTHQYKDYKDYIKFQLEKTSDKHRQQKWLGEEWRLKINIFKRVFNDNIDIIKNCKKCLCLGSRTGQEVVAFKELGVDDSLGIDLHKFEPYTIEGDIHDLNFDDNTFDLEFSNILDHSLYPKEFAKEIERTLKPGGYFILHYQFGINQDKFTETIIKDQTTLIDLFNKLEVISSRKIDTGIIAMNYEIIFRKKKLKFLLPNREDFLGSNYITKIGSFINADINNYEIYYSKNFPYMDSLYMKPFLDNYSEYNDMEEIIKPENHIRQNQAYPVLQLQQDIISYFTVNYKEKFYQILKEEANKRGYVLPWKDNSKIICIHIRLYDDHWHHGSDCQDYDGRGSGNYMKELIENNKIDTFSKENMKKYALKHGFNWGKNSHPDRQVAIGIDKLEKMIIDFKKEYPDKKIHIVTKLVKHKNNKRYLDIFEKYNLTVHSNKDYDYDLWLLIHSEILVLSKSTYSLVAGYYHQGTKVHYPIWGVFVSTGLYTKYDKSNWKYYI